MSKKVLLNTLNYLLIDFESYNKTLKHLVEKLDLVNINWLIEIQINDYYIPLLQNQRSNI